MKKLLKDIKKLVLPSKSGRSADRTITHFLHLGKNAGTQISMISKQINALSKRQAIVKHPHSIGLRDIPEDEPYFFSIRHPVPRFSSAFYSRKRKGQPRFYNEWTDVEKLAFNEFEHANDLAESLFEPGKVGQQAWAAMKSITHTSRNQCDWFSCYGNFLRTRPPLWIVRQEHFDKDLGILISVAFPEIDVSEINFTSDDVASHRNDYSKVPPLSQAATEKLERWYIQDMQLYEICSQWVERGGRL